MKQKIAGIFKEKDQTYLKINSNLTLRQQE